jgi:hypothetical protein
MALTGNKTGSFNTATGLVTLESNTSGSNNTANGLGALVSNTTGNNNIGIGFSAGSNLTTGSNNIDIGALGVAGEANTIRIGKSGTQTKTFVAGIAGKTVANGVGVLINTNGQLGTMVSSARFKEAIKPMDKKSEALLALHPVTFRYKQDLDPDGVPQFGLVAEQVEKVNPDLVVRGEDGKPYAVRYEAVNAMLLNEFLKEHRKVQELKEVAGTQAVAITQQQSTVSQLKATVAQQQKQIEVLTSGLQRVTARVEAANSVPCVASDN